MCQSAVLFRDLPYEHVFDFTWLHMCLASNLALCIQEWNIWLRFAFGLIPPMILISSNKGAQAVDDIIWPQMNRGCVAWIKFQACFRLSYQNWSDAWVIIYPCRHRNSGMPQRKAGYSYNWMDVLLMTACLWNETWNKQYLGGSLFLQSTARVRHTLIWQCLH